MKHCSLLCAGWWPIVLLPLLFMLPLLFFKWHAIEDDVANNTKLALSAESLDWAQVKTVNRGRHVLITGTPPSETSIKDAERVARAAYGVDKVSVSADAVPPAIPASLEATVVEGIVTLTGELASQDGIDSTVAKAVSAFGKNNVQNRLMIGKNLAALPSLVGFFENLDNKTGDSRSLVASIQGDTLSLQGVVPSANLKRDINNSFSRLFKGRINDKITVVAPAPVVPKVVAPAPIVKSDQCLGLVNEILSKNKINFESAKAQIKADSFELLERIKSIAERCPAVTFEIDGHTDSLGNPAFNMSLSKKRAQAVIDHLAGLGLDAARFNANGFGPNRPIADNGSPEGRAQNRRIEIRLKN